ncbi:4530_t:CDS:2, partial [Acaulospora morrowiae]
GSMENVVPFHSSYVWTFHVMYLHGKNSMCDSIDQAKEVVLKIMEELLQNGILVEADITCFFYSSSCVEVKFSDNPDMLWDNGEIQEYFNSVEAGGGTDFEKVFKSIIENLDNVNSNNDLAIIFFTDGKDSIRDDTKKELEDALLKTPYTTEVHTIGFTEGHDASLLSWLTTCGSKGGNFMYIKDSNEIPNILSVMIPLLELRDRTLYVKVGDQDPLAEQFDDQGSGTVILKGKVEGERITVLRHLRSHEKYEFQPPHQISNSNPKAIQSIIYYIQHEIQIFTNEIINHIKHNEHERIQRLLIEVERYEEQLNDILITASKKVLDMHDDIIQDTKSTIGEFKIILTKFVVTFFLTLHSLASAVYNANIVKSPRKSDGSLTNDKIANFNDLIYKNIRELKNPTIFKTPTQEIEEVSDSENTSVSDDTDDSSISDDRSISLLLDKISSLEANMNQKFDQLQSRLVKLKKIESEKAIENQDNQKVEEKETVSQDEQDNQKVEEKETVSQDEQDNQKVEEKETVSQDEQDNQKVEEKETVSQDEQKVQKNTKKPIICGSKIALVHVSTGRYLSARRGLRGTATVSQEQDINYDTDLWTITEANNSKGMSMGHPVHLKTTIRLKNEAKTGNLHCTSTKIKGKNSAKRKVTLYSGSNADDDWLIQRCEPSDSNTNYLANGDIVCLVHNATKNHALYYREPLS